MTPIIFIHGMWSTPKDWDKFKDVFKESGFQAYSPQLRHHSHDLADLNTLGQTSLLDYVDDLERFIKELDSLPILVGHSMGGLLAQILASRGFAKGAILLAPAPPAGVSIFHHSVVKIFSHMLLTWRFWNKPFLLGFSKAKWGIFNKMNECDARSHYVNFVPESGRVIFEIGFWYLDSKRASSVNSDEVTCPVLVFSGKDDRLTPISIVRRTAKRYRKTPNYKFIECTSHGHWLLGEPGWEEIATECIEWLKLNNTRGEFDAL